MLLQGWDEAKENTAEGTKRHLSGVEESFHDLKFFGVLMPILVAIDHNAIRGVFAGLYVR